MKKIAISVMLLSMFMYMLPFTSKAGGSSNNSITLSNLSSTIEGEINFKPSKDVTIMYGATDSAYGAYDWHSKGTKGYATGSGESKFYYDNCTGLCGSSGPTAPTINDNGTVSGWSEE